MEEDPIEEGYSSSWVNQFFNESMIEEVREEDTVSDGDEEGGSELGESDPVREDFNNVGDESVLEGSPLMKVRVGIQGGSCEALVDSGATVSLIRQSMVPKAVHFSESRMIRGLGGGNIPSTSVVELELKLGSLGFVEELKVVPDEAMKYDMILGGTFFVNNRVTIDFPRKLSGPISGGRWEYWG